MDFLGELLATFLGGTAIKALAKKTGISTRQLKKFLPLAVPFLIKLLTKNASSEEGASSLLAALAEHTDDKSVDKQIADADLLDGAKIIGHILGVGEKEELKDLSKKSKLSETDVSGILSSVAPALLTSLSAAVFGNQKTSSKKTSKTGKTGIAGLLSALFGGEQKTTGRKSTSKSKSRSRKTKETDEEFNGAELLSALLSSLK